MARHTRRQALRLGLLGAAPILASPAIRRLLDGSSDLAGSAGSHQHHSRYRSLAKAPASPAVTPFQVQLPVPPVLDASASFTPACELDPAWGPPTFREITMRKATVEIIPGLGTEIYGYNGLYPGPTIRARKGSPVAVRFRNDLDVDTCVHNHGGHQAGKFLGNTLKDSDSFPSDLIFPGGFKDYCYPSISPENDVSEFASTQWYHDHAMDVTGEQVYRGLAGFYLLTDDLEEGLVASGKLPGPAFDIPVVIQDKLFSANGELVYDTFDFNGFLGDRFVINGKVQPFFKVERKKYRFRFLNGSNARFYELELSSGSFLQIGNDSWLLPQAIPQQTLKIAPAQRADVIVDFRNAPSEVFLSNILVQESGRGPKKVKRPGTPLIKFLVQSGTPIDNATIAPGQALRPHRAIQAAEIVTTRRFEFERRHDAWQINHQFFDPNRDDATPKLGTAERWILKNGGGGWSHPIHIHDEAHQIQRINGKPPPLVDSFKKDTTTVGPDDEVEVFMKFRTFPGKFMVHCHNLEHEDMRMMAVFNVVP